VSIAKKTTKETVKEHFRKLAMKEYYLPYGHARDFTHIPKSMLCDNVECIKKHAINVLTSVDNKSEIYRQLVYILSTHVVVRGLTPYILAKIRAELAKTPIVTMAFAFFNAEIKSKKDWWRKEGYKKAVNAYGDLIQLNFAFSPILAYKASSGIFEVSEIEDRESRSYHKILVATMQSRLLRAFLPLRPNEPTTVREDIAELIIDFSIELRRRVVESFLKFRPRKVSDVFNYVYQWAKTRSDKLERLYSGFSSRLEDYIYEEIFLAPYYLNYYGLINIDLLKYDMYWVISE